MRGFRRSTASTSSSSAVPPRWVMRASGIARQACKEVANVFPSLRLNISDNNLDTAVSQLAGVFQHLIGFPDAGGIAKIDFEMSGAPSRQSWLICLFV